MWPKIVGHTYTSTQPTSCLHTNLEKLRTLEWGFKKKSFQVNDFSLQVGAAVSLSNLIGLLQENQSKLASFEQLAGYLLTIANVPVRNIGSWAGNLMLTHDHDNIPSDIFTMMAGVGAKITVVTAPSKLYPTLILGWVLSINLEYRVDQCNWPDYVYIIGLKRNQLNPTLQ